MNHARGLLSKESQVTLGILGPNEKRHSRGKEDEKKSTRDGYRGFRLSRRSELCLDSVELARNGSDSSLKQAHCEEFPALLQADSAKWKTSLVEVPSRAIEP
jgi:hypothetical protein